MSTVPPPDAPPDVVFDVVIVGLGPVGATAAILFAASPEGSYMNGTVIAVDAGLGGREAGPA